MTKSKDIAHIYTNISTHTLSWSVTTEEEPTEEEPTISTHTLSWSVTYPANMVLPNILYFNSHALVERDVLVMVFRLVTI